ncbi:MAG: diguanylate cyclase [Candidatus Aureabacteria bacterium]|nr:diguanylate cyclase [Candidatus Auribacterota bacterium]
MKLRTQLFITISLISVAVVGTIGWVVYWEVERAIFDQLRSTLSVYASAAAMLVDGDKHAALAQQGDMRSPYFIELYATLKKFKSIDPRISECYTMVKSDTPNVWQFVIDASEATDDNGDGVILDNEKPALLGEKYDVSAYPEMQKAFEGTITDREINQDKWGRWLSAYAPVRDSHGRAIAIVGLDISAETLRSQEAPLKKLILAICCIFLTIAFCLARCCASRFTRPLSAIMKAATEIGGGNYDYRVNVAGGEEIRFLAGTMNSMAENIRRSFDKLSTLHRTANIFASTLDIEEALRISLNLAVEVTRSTRGVIFLVDSANARIRMAIGEGIEEVRLYNNEYRIGRFVFPAFLQEDREAQIQQWLVASGCTECFPLTIHDITRGYVLLNPEIHDKKFLSTLMNQISFAIDNARLFHDTITDGLTGLFLKSCFKMQLDTELKRVKRHGKDMSVLMLDIDHFKKINDTYGHPQGDKLLQEIAKRIKGCVREVDIVSRFGGEEIALILSETSAKSAKIVAEKIRKTVNRKGFPLAGSLVMVTVSIGIFTIRAGEGVTADEAVENADVALYLAKGGGRNRVIVFRG